MPGSCLRHRGRGPGSLSRPALSSGEAPRPSPPSAATKTSAMTNVRGLGSEVAIAVVTKLTGQAPSATEASEAVDQVLARG